MLKMYFLMFQKRDQYPCLFINSPFMDCSSEVQEVTCPTKSSWHLMAPDAITHLSATTQNEGCPFQEQSSITGLPQSEQRAELSLETQDVSMLITRRYLATSAPRHRVVFFHRQHHLSGPLALSFALPLTHTDGSLSAPARSCLD